MSTLDQDLDVSGQNFLTNGFEVSQARIATVGDMSVRRLLPLRLRRSIGAWCFVDHYGPMSVDGVGVGSTGVMAVPPHPHIGLQTVTWLFTGNVLHRDSLGSEQMIRPGQLNLMTSGRGIAHAEESPAQHDPQLHGVQLWVALPDASRFTEPAFEHHAELPFMGSDGLTITVFMGCLTGTCSPATTFSHLVGAQLVATRDVNTSLAVNPDFEHAVFVADGRARVAGADLAPGTLIYLPTGHPNVPMAAPTGTTLLLLGGVPLGEPLLMWWNFVARTPHEMAAAVADWREGKFGEVGGYVGEPLKAPPLRADLLVRRDRG
jgi:redox-sensitive bicupin YhaK (pirin superfamily)